MKTKLVVTLGFGINFGILMLTESLTNSLDFYTANSAFEVFHMVVVYSAQTLTVIALCCIVPLPFWAIERFGRKERLSFASSAVVASILAGVAIILAASKDLVD